MAVITVSHKDGDTYLVSIDEGGSTSRHEVTATPAQVAEFGGGAAAQQLLEASFRFLLEREPKEAILSRFELSVIGRYFPEYPAEIRRRLSG